MKRFGAPHLVFNNAGVGFGGFIWEHTVNDWDWVIGVNLWGVAHGVRVFAPMMLEGAAKADPAWRRTHRQHRVDGRHRQRPQHGRLQRHQARRRQPLSETLDQDLKLVTDQVSASVLCPYFVPTGISTSRTATAPETTDEHKPTKSQLVAQGDERGGCHLGQGHRGRRRPAHLRGHRRRSLLHLQPPLRPRPRPLEARRRRRLARNPSDPFADKPQIGAELRAKLRAAD